MPKQEILSKTGDAPIKQQGHTANGNFGSGPNPKAKWSGGGSDLKIK